MINEVNRELEKFNSFDASRRIEEFVLDLSTWYVRRIRGRVGPTSTDKELKENTYQVLYTVITVLSKLMATFAPFVTEEIYKNLTGEESVHLTDYPLADESVINKELGREMEQVRKLAEIGHSLRKEHGVKVRQPLSLFSY